MTVLHLTLIFGIWLPCMDFIAHGIYGKLIFFLTLFLYPSLPPSFPSFLPSPLTKSIYPFMGSVISYYLFQGFPSTFFPGAFWFPTLIDAIALIFRLHPGFLKADSLFIFGCFGWLVLQLILSRLVDSVGKPGSHLLAACRQTLLAWLGFHGVFLISST